MILRMDIQYKQNFYDKATVSLLAQLGDMGLESQEYKNAKFYTERFRNAFKNDKVKRYVFLASNNNVWNFGYDSAGFCYAASVVFSIMNGFRNWNLMYIDETNWNGGHPHYYLQHTKTGTFFDITYDQFAIDGITVPYDKGVKTAPALTPDDIPFKFAKILNIDFIKALTNKRTQNYATAGTIR